MTGGIISYDPCSLCEQKNKCKICELTYRRGGVITDHKAQDILLNLKKEIHDKAVYPRGLGVRPYITVAAFDAIINNKIEEIRNEKEK